MYGIRLQRWSIAASMALLSACATLGQGGFDPPHVSLVDLLDRVKDVRFGQAQGMKVTIVGGVSLANRAGELPFKFQGEIGGRGGNK